MSTVATSSALIINSSQQIIPGFKFEPTPEEIFTHFLPKRVLGQQVLPPSYEFLVRDVDLYGDKTPGDLFGGSDFYCFTRLKKHNGSNIRASRVVGGGTWSGERPEDYYTTIIDNDGGNKEMKIGTKRLFKFKFNTNKRQVNQSESNPNDLGCNNWLMHEFTLDKDYLAYYYMVHHPQSSLNTPLLEFENIVFCHVYKKNEANLKAGNKRSIICQHHLNNFEEKKRKICSNEDNVIAIEEEEVFLDSGRNTMELVLAPEVMPEESYITEDDSCNNRVNYNWDNIKTLEGNDLERFLCDILLCDTEDQDPVEDIGNTHDEEYFKDFLLPDPNTLSLW